MPFPFGFLYLLLGLVPGLSGVPAFPLVCLGKPSPPFLLVLGGVPGRLFPLPFSSSLDVVLQFDAH